MVLAFKRLLPVHQIQYQKIDRKKIRQNKFATFCFNKFCKHFTFDEDFGVPRALMKLQINREIATRK